METPYGYHDVERIRADLAAAGWEDVRLEPVRVQSLGESAADFAAGFVFGSPLSHELAERNADLDAVAVALTDALIPVGGERPFRPELAATVITAVR
jgi:hypothetical protein